jgi:hypothetical protein
MIAALTFCLILILAAVVITLENRIVTLTKRVRLLEKLSHYHRPAESND